MYYKFSDYTDMGIVSSDLRAPRSTAKSMGKSGVSVRQVFLLDGDAGHTRVSTVMFFHRLDLACGCLAGSCGSQRGSQPLIVGRQASTFKRQQTPHVGIDAFLWLFGHELPFFWCLGVLRRVLGERASCSHLLHGEREAARHAGAHCRGSGLE